MANPKTKQKEQGGDNTHKLDNTSNVNWSQISQSKKIRMSNL